MDLLCPLTGEPIEATLPKYLVIGFDGFVTLAYASCDSQAAAQARINWEFQHEFPNVQFKVIRI